MARVAIAMAAMSLVFAEPLAVDSAALPVEVSSGIVIENVDTTEFPSVLLTVGVSGGLAALEASGEQFKVFENGVERPFEIVPIDSVDDLNVVIVFDRSGSMGTQPLRAAKDAALAFVTALPPEVAIGLVSFSTEATIDVPITQDREALNSAIEVLDSDGNTSLYDGVILATSLFSPAVERNVLVVLSDGGDNDSTATLEEAVAAVQDFTVEMIELATPESNRDALDQLAAPLPVRSTDDPAQLEELYTSVAQRLVGRVGLRYQSLITPGSGSSVTVQLGDLESSSTSAEFQAPLPPSTLPLTTLPEIDIVEPIKQTSDTTAARIFSFILICGGLLVSARFATDRRIRASRQRLIPKGTVARGKTRTKDLFAGIKNWLETNERQRKLVADIESLGFDRSPGSVILTTVGLAIFAGLLGLFMQGLLLGLVLALGVLLFSRSRLRSKVAARRTNFIAQLPETLGTLSSMLRTGYGLLQALNAVAEESSEPTKSLLSRVILEVSTGRDVIEALRAIGTQIDSIDFDWVVAGIEISRDTGGDLAKTLDTVAETIRDRDKLRGQVKALTAEGRISAYVMLALPPGVGILSYVINPDFSGVLLEPIGLVLLSIVGVLMTFGYFWMRSMVAKVTL